MSVKNILISQQQPQMASPYTVIAEKFGVHFDFKPFFKNEPLSSREFRDKLDALAAALIERETMDGRDVEALLGVERKEEPDAPA